MLVGHFCDVHPRSVSADQPDAMCSDSAASPIGLLWRLISPRRAVLVPSAASDPARCEPRRRSVWLPALGIVCLSFFAAI